MLIFISVKRFLAAASEPVFPLLAVFVALIGLIVNQATATFRIPSTWLWVIFGVALVVWAVQTWFGYVRRTHDPTWTLAYQKIWDDADAYTRRSVAAATIQKYDAELANLEKYRVELSDIDDALDILEDVGFYVFGDQISPESAHHHFYYWIQGYWCSAQRYIKAVQRDDPTRWENIGPLFDVTSTVEINKSHGKLTREKLQLSDTDRRKFLDEEKNLDE